MQWICKKIRGRPAKLVRSRCGSKVLGTPGSGFHGAAFPLLLKLVSPEAASWAPQVMPACGTRALPAQRLPHPRLTNPR